MTLYGNLSSEVNVLSSGWYYGMEITKSTDVDSCPIILPLSFAANVGDFDDDDFYASAKMVSNITDCGNFKKVDYHFWSGADWREQDNNSIFFVVALPRGTHPISSAFNSYDSTAPDNGNGFYMKSGVQNPISICMYDGKVGSYHINEAVRLRIERNVNIFISNFGVDKLPFKLRDIITSDSEYIYYNTFMEILKDREFVVIRKVSVTGDTPLSKLALSGSFYID